MENKRQHKRIDKVISMHYLITDAEPKVWDMSVVQNIGPGGIMFIAPSDMIFKDKILLLQIKLPQLAPNSLQLEAMVVNITPRANPKQSEIRAKFINLTPTNKEQLLIIQKMIESKEIKNTAKY